MVQFLKPNKEKIDDKTVVIQGTGFGKNEPQKNQQM